MRADELRPCDLCGGALLPSPAFWVMRVSLAVFDQRAIQQLSGVTQILGGGPQALGIATAFAPEHVVKLAADEPDGEWEDIILCNDCYCTGGPVRTSPAGLVEAALEAKRKIAERSEG